MKIINYLKDIINKYFNKIENFNNSNNIIKIIPYKLFYSSKKEQNIKNFILSILKEYKFIERFNFELRMKGIKIMQDNDISKYIKKGKYFGMTSHKVMLINELLKKGIYNDSTIIQYKQNIIKILDSFIEEIKNLDDYSYLYKPSLDKHTFGYIDFFDKESFSDNGYYYEYCTELFYYINSDSNKEILFT